MSDNEYLKKLVVKAGKNGWEDAFLYMVTLEDLEDDGILSPEPILYNKGFMFAIFGQDWRVKGVDMLLSEDPFEYLKENVNA